MGSLTELAGEAGPSREEQRCEAWGPWSPWAPCSQTRGPGVQGCSRRCSPPSLPVLRHCPGPEPQTQACFTAACPGEGSWAPGGQWGGRGLQRAGGRKTLVPGPTSQPASPLVGPSSSPWTVSGPPGLPGPRALSHAGAPGPGSGSATHPGTAARPVPCCLGTLPAPARPVSGREEGTVGEVWRGCWRAACP